MQFWCQINTVVFKEEQWKYQSQQQPAALKHSHIKDCLAADVMYPSAIP